MFFTTAGMHPLVPFLLGHPHPAGKKLVNVQRCIRTGDIEKIGNKTHHTFFEMLGNWSLGNYFKQDAIKYSFEFLTKTLKIPKKKIVVSCFKGDKNAPKDIVSAEIWKSLGIKKIKFLPKSENWWGPAGKTGPCGPDTEIFVNNMEIWNDVFMQYNKNKQGKYLPLKQKNVDTGMGVERTITILNNLDDNYLSECFLPIIKKIEKLSGKKYKGNEKFMRIIADHIKAATFIIADGIVPSNFEQGYVVRRLIRRAIRYGKKLGMENFVKQIAEPVFQIYDDYNILAENKGKILKELENEEKKFSKTLEIGLRKFNKMATDKVISGKEAFLLFQSYGFPIEITQELAKEKNIKIKIKEYGAEVKKHQKLSKTATQGRFKSGLADNSEATTKLHTATHLLLAALRKVLKNKDINQRGSNITPERLRFDFNFSRKLTEKEIKSVEDFINKKIKEKIPVQRDEMSIDKAKKQGAIGVFDNKYKGKVSVYTIANFSKEICAGPHVDNLRELGKFKIIKEESSSAGVRRIKAKLE